MYLLLAHQHGGDTSIPSVAPLYLIDNPYLALRKAREIFLQDFDNRLIHTITIFEMGSGRVYDVADSIRFTGHGAELNTSSCIVVCILKQMPFYATEGGVWPREKFYCNFDGRGRQLLQAATDIADFDAGKPLCSKEFTDHRPSFEIADYYSCGRPQGHDGRCDHGEW